MDEPLAPGRAAAATAAQLDRDHTGVVGEGEGAGDLAAAPPVPPDPELVFTATATAPVEGQRGRHRSRPGVWPSRSSSSWGRALQLAATGVVVAPATVAVVVTATTEKTPATRAAAMAQPHRRPSAATGTVGQTSVSTGAWTREQRALNASTDLPLTPGRSVPRSATPSGPSQRPNAQLRHSTLKQQIFTARRGLSATRIEVTDTSSPLNGESGR